MKTEYSNAKTAHFIKDSSVWYSFSSTVYFTIIQRSKLNACVFSIYGLFLNSLFTDSFLEVQFIKMSNQLCFFTNKNLFE